MMAPAWSRSSWPRHRFGPPSRKILDARLRAHGSDDVTASGELLGTVHQLHARSAPSQLERVERAAVTASNHRNGPPGEVSGARLELVRDVAAEPAVRRSRKVLVARAGGQHERPTLQAGIAELDRTFAQVHLDDSLRQPQARAEDCGGVLERALKVRAVGEAPRREVPNRVRDL